MRRVLATCAAFLAATCAPAAAAPAFHDAAGLHVAGVKQVGPRLFALTVTTKALPAAANVYVLMPPDYESRPHRRWPVFYLLDGTSGRASDWTSQGDAEKVIGDREVITVMPDITLNGNGGGWCTDWPNGAQAWETFHIAQLLPWVDTNLRTLRSRGKRAIAGLSQGGFCSMSYAARHPDLFGVALGYSAAPDIYYDYEQRVGAAAIIGATEVGLTHVPPGTFFGDPVTNGANWAAHDPTSIAENLRSTRMYMYWGNGLPGPLDPDPVSGLGGASEIEGAVDQSNQGFQRRVNALGIPAYFNAYGPGTHTWAYWKRDLQWSIDKVMADFADPVRQPVQFTYTSGDDSYAVYGWRVALRRGERGFSTLNASGCTGFALSGSGAGDVSTPACLRRGARYRVTMTGPNVESSTVLAAGRDRRLALNVPLGPSGGTTTSVRILPLRQTAAKPTRRR
jgi:S-formylglutathione hydrolase FrmB